jgi:hypothetical protein
MRRVFYFKPFSEYPEVPKGHYLSGAAVELVGVDVELHENGSILLTQFGSSKYGTFTNDDDTTWLTAINSLNNPQWITKGIPAKAPPGVTMTSTDAE